MKKCIKCRYYDEYEESETIGNYTNVTYKAYCKKISLLSKKVPPEKVNKRGNCRFYKRRWW